MFSKKLTRQLKKNFDGEDIQPRLDALAAKDPSLSQLASGFKSFCESIDEAYSEHERLLDVAQRNLEISSQELHELNQNLTQLNSTFDAMVNSLGQGFLLFDRSGTCLPVYSRACFQLLETDPPGRNILDVLRVPEEKRAGFQDWYMMCFEERLEFEELAVLGPALFAHSQGRHIALQFKPVRDKALNVALILVIATDRTDEVVARRQAEDNQNYANMVLFILKDRAEFHRLFEAARTLVSEASQTIRSNEPEHVKLEQVQRKLHTLKAISATLYASRIRDRVQKVELRLLDEHDGRVRLNLLTAAVQDIETEFDDLVDRIQDLAGRAGGKMREIATTHLEDFAQLLSSGKHNIQELERIYRERILATPIEDIFLPFNEILSQTAGRLNKLVGRLEVTGDKVSVRRENYEPVWTSLSNVFRNIVDHGIEDPETRRKSGKREAGSVAVEVRRLQSPTPLLEIKIKDDGAGINIDRLKERLNYMGRDTAQASREEVINSIFDRGVSTAASVTDISGMGIGLSSVKEAVQKCGGNINVESENGRGTVFTLRLPIAS